MVFEFWVVEITKPTPAYAAKSVVVVNFPSLVSLMINNFINNLVPYILNQLDLRRFEKGELKDFLLTEVEKYLNQVYGNFYRSVQSEVFKRTQDPEKWYKVVVKSDPSSTIPPVLSLESDADLQEKITNYAHYVQGDLAYLNKLYDEVENNPNVDEMSKEVIKVQIRNLQSAKVSLAQQVIETASTVKKMQELKKLLDKQYAEIDKAYQYSNYSTDAAVKDLLKVEMINSMLMMELLRMQANDNMIRTAILNKELNKQRERLADKLSTMTVRVIKGKH
jgi:hypothetical protein